MKNIYKLLVIGASVLLFLELLVFYWLNSSFYYILNIDFYFSFIVIQLFFLFIIMNVRKGKKVILPYYVIVIIMLPVLFVSSLPEYSYSEGKLLIENNYFEEETYQYISMGDKTVPVSDKHSFHSWLLKDYFYYYQVTAQDEEYYFSVDPVNGHVYEHENDFFRRDG